MIWPVATIILLIALSPFLAAVARSLRADRLITWARPARPPWMSQEEYECIPHTLTLRELRFDVTVPAASNRVSSSAADIATPSCNVHAIS